MLLEPFLDEQQFLFRCQHSYVSLTLISVLLPFPSNNQVMILQDPKLGRSTPSVNGGKWLQCSVSISTQLRLLVLMVKMIKELGLNINEELREDDVAMAFITVLFVQDNESPGEQRAQPACWLLLHFTRNPCY